MLGAFVLATALVLWICVGAASATPSIGIASFDGTALEQSGSPATQAGSHPQSVSVHISLATIAVGEEVFPLEDLKDAVFEFPPGLTANPLVVERCSEAVFAAGARACPAESQVGVFTLESLAGSAAYLTQAALYSLKPPSGTAALFGFWISSDPIRISSALHGDEFRISTIVTNAPEAVLVSGFGVEFWGIPADPSHDEMRGFCLDEFVGPTGAACPSADAANPKAFLSLPTSCTGPVRTDLFVTGWQGGTDTAGFLSHDDTEPVPNPIGAEGCNALDFSPSLEARPTSNVTDSPSGFSFHLRIPEGNIAAPADRVEAHLRKAVVELPAGISINPAGANGLGACSPAQIDLADSAPPTCPGAARIGSLEVQTPLVGRPLLGSVYLAAPFDNPFDSLLALYLVVDDPRSGTTVKLPGKVEADPNSGRLTATFAEGPQLPFENLQLNLFPGATAPLRTPEACGLFMTTSVLTPYSAPESGPPATPVDSYAIERDPRGGPCASSNQRPEDASLDIGTVSPVAGVESPLVVSLRREDGSRQISGLDVTLPPGLVGSVAGIPACSDQALATAPLAPGAGQAAHPSCPPASRVGSVDLGAGAGPAPFNVSGAIYLAGPYEGAPLSLAAVVPAVAGPFDLGTVVSRIAVFVDPRTAQLHLVSDPLPSMRNGIPLDLRTVRVLLDRPGFVANPTSCDPMSISARVHYLGGGEVPVSERFQLGNCRQLHFQPGFGLRIAYGTTRNGNPGLTVLLRPRTGDARLDRASLVLPRGELIAIGHLRDVCSRRYFEASACPRASRVGSAETWSPLLDTPLRGGLYLLESERRYPDLGVALDGRFPLRIVGHIDTPHLTVRARFDRLPDLPLSRVRLVLDGGGHGLLANSIGLCRGARHATARIEAHNGDLLVLHPRARAVCDGSGSR
jgi:hypothetical protein